MARPRKSTALHLIQGTLHATRHADRADEPEILEPLGGPPASWPVESKLLWAELADLVPAGVATKADRIALELLCRLVAQLREGPESFTPALATHRCG